MGYHGFLSSRKNAPGLNLPIKVEERSTQVTTQVTTQVRGVGLDFAGNSSQSPNSG